MSPVQKIWEPVHFDARWKNVNTEEFDNLRPSWDKRRVELSKNRDQYNDFIDKLKRKQAIDTGIIENMYDLDRGITETLIQKGFVDSHLQHNDTNIDKELLMDHLQDNFDAMDFIFHHAFTQIHPFQDGNGRVARLLASFVLIKDNLFPFSLDREEKNIYIDALEGADKGNYQNLVDVIANNQIESIKKAFKLETVGKDSSYDKVLKELKNRIANKKAADQQNIVNNMQATFELIKEQTEDYKENLMSVLGETVAIEIESCDPSGEKEYFYTYQIARYAKKHEYYFNSSLPRRWTRIRISFDDTHKYQLVLSLHHYGYDNSTFAIGAFIEKPQHMEVQGQNNEQILFPLVNPPYVFFSGKDISTIRESICEKIGSIFTETLAYIAEEFS